ncbi:MULTISPECIES: IS91 family transposase [unclassified Rhizobium]|uniref:IS91 family transposase n=1 Tax=unclassified Rhizobium TaxID=2613769 RepID=UPI000EAA7A5C|nr:MULTISPECIES: IS91 family transposase [unclassified Rhizobium]AYG70523.1 IS91 family transposase [Rhizobium sp. CCGE531]AYG76739.1 IS91 family transposase [Rhizobium sp. CCGE532]AYG76849.1 IS91 family transposase [Rhizobium sp. CCGE532]AYG76851.1 IS91 family transposase [Rhizobium sp. CCGE532]
MRSTFEVADIFRRHGSSYRRENAGHLGRGERRVMGAIEACRTPRLGGHVDACDDCGRTRISYNSCRNRHCPKCQGAARKEWVDARVADLLPVPYFHVVFTLPSGIAEIAFHNKAVVYALLMRIAAQTLQTVAAEPKRLGAEIGIIAVLHTWGQAMTHHPHVHCVVPGGGLSPDKSKWIACRPGFFLPVRVLSRLFRRLFLTALADAFAHGELRFSNALAHLADPAAFTCHLAHARRSEWVVYAKPPFGGPDQVLAYLGRYTHRVAIANSRIVEVNDGHVAFRWKDYRSNGRDREKIMRLNPHEFIRRFLLHVLPDGFHRMRHFGFLANSHRRDRIGLCRELLYTPSPAGEQPQTGKSQHGQSYECPDCRRPMRRTGINVAPVSPPQPSSFRCDTS